MLVNDTKYILGAFGAVGAGQGRKIQESRLDFPMMQLVSVLIPVPVLIPPTGGERAARQSSSCSGCTRGLQRRGPCRWTQTSQWRSIHLSVEGVRR